MSHYALHQGAINSGAINHVGFPGSEDGLSLIELTGQVQAQASLSSIRLRLTVGALVAAVATSVPAETRAKFALGASTTCNAGTSVAAISKASVYPSPQDALVTYVADALLKISVAATTNGNCSTDPASGLTRVSRAAATNGVVTASSSSLKRIYIQASGSGTANAPGIYSVKHMFTDCATDAIVSQSTSITLKYLVGGSTTCESTSSVVELIAKTVGASTDAVSEGIASINLYRPVYPTPESASANASVTAGLRITFEAVGDAVADAAAEVAMEYRLGAAVSTAVNTSTAAADYSVTIPAPEERVMVVLASNRRMEVTE